jgi:hypothetical protein
VPFAALAVTLTYHMLDVNFVVGRVVALPAGIITAAALGYLSVCFLDVIESTSIGHTNVDSLQGDWRDWFWTLPATLGMLAMAAAIGWILSLVLPVNVWLLIALCALMLYPVFQLSSLEAGSPVVPSAFSTYSSQGACQSDDGDPGTSCVILPMSSSPSIRRKHISIRWQGSGASTG